MELSVEGRKRTHSKDPWDRRILPKMTPRTWLEEEFAGAAFHLDTNAATSEYTAFACSSFPSNHLVDTRDSPARPGEEVEPYRTRFLEQLS